MSSIAEYADIGTNPDMIALGDGKQVIDQGTAKFVSQGTRLNMRALDPAGMVEGFGELLRDHLSLYGLQNTIPKDENGVDYDVCGRCGQYVKRAGFRRDANRFHGHDPVCKECRHEQYLQSK